MIFSFRLTQSFFVWKVETNTSGQKTFSINIDQNNLITTNSNTSKFRSMLVWIITQSIQVLFWLQDILLKQVGISEKINFWSLVIFAKKCDPIGLLQKKKCATNISTKELNFPWCAFFYMYKKSWFHNPKGRFKCEIQATLNIIYITIKMQFVLE